MNNSNNNKLINNSDTCGLCKTQLVLCNINI